jgi:hypothetical protein
MKRDDTIINNQSEISEILNEQFHSIFVDKGRDPLPDFQMRNASNSLDID